jgi:hypothetical protein
MKMAIDALKAHLHPHKILPRWMLEIFQLKNILRNYFSLRHAMLHRWACFKINYNFLVDGASFP